MKPAAWSLRSHNRPSAGRYAIIKGRAYPRVQRGKNPTDVIDIPLPQESGRREQYYNHAAVTLSDSDLDDIEGAEGAPICEEHNRNDRVGVVHHSWVNTADGGRALDIIGRIPLDTERGRRVIEDIRCGRIKGLSVSYGTDLEERGDGTRKLKSKTFHEISLCREPFFEGCNLSVGVVASAKQGKLRNKNVSLHNNVAFSLDANKKTEARIFIPLAMSDATPPAEQSSSSSSSAATPSQPQQQQQQQQQQSFVPGSNNDAADLLKQADSLKEQLEEARRAQATAEKSQAEKDAMLKRLLAKEATESKRYADAQEPKLKEVIEGEEARQGPMTEDRKTTLRRLFTVPDFKDNAERHYKEHRNAVELAASKKAQEEEIAALKAEKIKLTELMSRTAQSIGGMRASYAQAMPSAAADIAASAAAEKDAIGSRKDVGVEASGLSLSDMMVPVPVPSKESMSWLQPYGYTNEVSVSASVTEDGVMQRAVPRAVHAAPGHRLLYDPEGERTHPMSMRWLNPAHAGFMFNNTSLMRDNLDNYVSIDASRSGILEEKRVDDAKNHIIGDK